MGIHNHYRSKFGINCIVAKETVYFYMRIPQYMPQLIMHDFSEFDGWSFQVYYTMDASQPQHRTLYVSSEISTTNALYSGLVFRKEIQEAFSLFKPI